MFAPNWEENAQSIEDYLNDDSFFKYRKTDELFSFLDAKQLKPDNFDLFFNNISTYHDKHTILDIISHANVEYCSNISDILMNINTLFHILKISLLLKMSKSIYSIFHNILTNSIIEEIKQRIDEMKEVQCNSLEDVKKLQNQKMEEMKNKIDEIMKIHNTKLDEVKGKIDDIKWKINDVNWKIEDLSKNVKLPLRHKNFDKLKIIQKTSANFDKIYISFEKIANEDDFISLKLAIESRYHEVTMEKYENTKNIFTYGAVRNNFKLVKMLAENGLIPFKNGPSGSSPLWFLCRNGNLEAAKYICELPGADFNSHSNYNITILYVASFNDFYEICEYLLSFKDIDVNMKNTDDGSTALSIAQTYRIRNLLKSHGAK